MTAEGAPLRILQLYPKGDYFTGAAIQLRELAAGLAARGHAVVVGTRPSACWTAAARADGLVHYALPMSSPLDLRSVAGLVRILRRHRIQIVHAQKGRARTLALLAGALAPFEALVLNRGVSFPLGPFGRLGYTTRRVHAIVVVAQALKQGLVAAGVPAGKIHVIHSGTDTDRFHPGVDGSGIRRELALGPDDFLFTQIGVRSSKGNDDVLAAFAALPPSVSSASSQAVSSATARAVPPAHLLLVGARQPEALGERARAAGVADRVHVWGYREDVPEILHASDCCVDASWVGLGLTGTLREALAVGTPVVASALAGNPELVVDGETGLLFPPRDRGALAHAMARMRAEPELGARTAAAGRARVAARFSTRHKLDATEALYRRLVPAACAA